MRRFSWPATPLGQLRALTLAVAAGGVLLLVPALLQGNAPPVLRAAALALLTGLVVHWVAGYRRGRFPAAVEPLEVCAIAFVGCLVAPEVMILPLLAVLFRSLYGGPLLTAARVLMYGAGLEAIVLIGKDLTLDAALERDLGHLIIALSGQAFLRSLARQEVGEETLRLYRNLTDRALYTLDDEGHIATWDAGAEGMFGHSPDSVLGRHAAAALAPDGAAREAVESELKCAAEHGSSESQGWRLISEGSPLYLDVITTALRNERGELRGYSQLVHDVTARHAADEALRESRERLRVVVRNAPITLWSLDREGVCTLYEGGLPAFGRDEFVGRAFNEMLGDWPELLEGNREALAGREAACVVDFGPRVVDCRFVPLLDGGGEVTGTFGVAADITERARAEAAQEHLRDQLVQSQRLETVGQLAGGIAHDFNNLLGVILSYAEFVSDQLPEGSSLADDVSEIQAAAERAAGLTRQLLVFSRRHKVSAEVLDLNSVLDDMEKLLRRALTEDLKFETHFERPLWAVEADPTRVEQILMNLVVNARDATPAGGTLTIETANVELTEADVRAGALTPGSFVRLRVQDTGRGMPAEVAERAFEPFFTTKGGAGSGLGLATVYGIVKQAGGQVTITSEPGAGTVVQVDLPATSRAVESHDTSSRPAPPPGQGQRVLIVEDETAIGESTLRILQHGGYRGLFANDAVSAIALVREHDDIELVISDVVMPDVKGPELVARLHEHLPDVKVLFMSGYVASEIAHEDVEPLILKPFGAADLLDRVGALLEPRHSAAHAGASA